MLNTFHQVYLGKYVSSGICKDPLSMISILLDELQLSLIVFEFAKTLLLTHKPKILIENFAI